MSALAAPLEGVSTTMVSTQRGVLAVADLPAGPGGSGAAVLLVPGYTGSKEDFGPVLPPLAAAGYRCVAVDLRGQYESPGTAPAADYALPALAADLLALLDALTLPAVHLVGHSFGGLVCRELVLSAPARVRSLTLLGSGPAAISGDRAKAIEALRPLVARVEGPAAWRQLADSLATTDFGRARYRSTSPAALLGMAATLLTAPDRTAALAEVTSSHAIPVLVAHGVRDDAWPPAVQRAMAAALGARYETIKQAAHSPAVEAPAATASVLLAALRSQCR